jgi:four helix bundle protein
MTTTFKDLASYRRAFEFAADMHDAVVKWPNVELWSVGIQLIRAADSVGANIAEALGRWHQPDRKRLLYIARGSLDETEHWVLCAEERGLLPQGSSQRLSDIRRPLNGLIRKSRPG